jgi:hypothetical protein
VLTRRLSLLLPVLLAACSGEERPRVYPPLRYDYLVPLRLNVSTIQIEQRFQPAGTPPDVSQYDPIPPVTALRTMAQDRLQALGSADLAIFVIQDASLTRRGDTLSGNFSVQLEIYNTPTNRVGYAQATVSSTYTGDLDDLPGRLYAMTKDMMDRMNVEFEYQVRHALGAWLLPAGAVQPPVESQPLAPSGPGEPPNPTPSSLPGPSAPPATLPQPEPMPTSP